MACALCPAPIDTPTPSLARLARWRKVEMSVFKWTVYSSKMKAFEESPWSSRNYPVRNWCTWARSLSSPAKSSELP